jgi:DNA modification methylase
VPDDVWDFPRVVGNAGERRAWHPTQHPEGLITRIVQLTSPSSVYDLCAGTGTVLRVCKRLKIECVSVEIDPLYAGKIAQENEVPYENILYHGDTERT